MNKIDRRIVEAIKKSPYIRVVFEFGDGPTEIEVKGDKLYSHDIGIATQSYINRKEKYGK